MKKRLIEYGGIAASVVLIAFGIGSMVAGFAGRDTVRDNLRQENIVGTPDSKIPGQLVDTGSEARAFADVMRHHALESTGGQTYAEMGRFVDENGKATNDEKAAAKDPRSGEAAPNPARNIWVTETALATALNQAYFAEQVALFSIVMGVALFLAGIGFLILTLKALRPVEATEERRQEAPAKGGVVTSH